MLFYITIKNQNLNITDYIVSPYFIRSRAKTLNSSLFLHFFQCKIRALFLTFPPFLVSSLFPAQEDVILLKKKLKIIITAIFSCILSLQLLMTFKEHTWGSMSLERLTTDIYSMSLFTTILGFTYIFDIPYPILPRDFSSFTIFTIQNAMQHQ